MAGFPPQISVGSYPDIKAAIIYASWHPEICDSLRMGARRALEMADVSHIIEVGVAGSFEIPLATQLAFSNDCDVAVVVGLVLRGETPHFDYVCQGVTQGILDIQLKFSRPIGFGVLMCDSLSQAQARAGLPGSKEDKGFDSAIAALSVLDAKKKLGGRENEVKSTAE